jgi:hypothetical protein
MEESQRLSTDYRSAVLQFRGDANGSEFLS